MRSFLMVIAGFVLQSIGMFMVGAPEILSVPDIGTLVLVFAGVFYGNA